MNALVLSKSGPRKTDKCLPQYFNKLDSNAFILSGAEDLIPKFEKDGAGQWLPRDGKKVIYDQPRPINYITYNNRRYRPRNRGLFGRIERLSNVTAPSLIHWRNISRDNILTIYGQDDNA